MPIQHAVLALLAQGPSHGYELKARFENEIGPQWGALNIGHIYQVIDRLVRDGLVVGTRVQQDNRPDKTAYELSDAGQRELDSWIATPWVRQTGFRDELFLKLFAASRLGRSALQQVVRSQREVYLRELGTLAELRGGHHDDPLVDLLIEAAELHTQAALTVVERAEDRLSGIASRAPAVGARNAVDEASEPMPPTGDGRTDRSA